MSRRYEADVTSGTIPACQWVRKACERNVRDLARQETAGFPYRFVPEAAIRVCRMGEMLPHIKGPQAFVTGRDEANRPIWNTITLEPWQCWIVTTLYGWQGPAGRRRFRVGFVLVPRKNAKSTLAAILVLYMLTADGESGAECYSAATTRDQAKVIAEIAWEMARRSPAFCEFYGVRIGSKTTRTLEVIQTAGKFSPLSADANSLDGLNVSFAAIDEFHAHRTRGVYDVLDTATGTRRQPLLFPITTAGVEIGGICHEKVQYLEKVLTGAVQDETWFGVNYTIDPGDDIKLAKTQRKANPNYGVSVEPDDLERKIAAGQHSPSALNNVLTKHFNVWIRTESAWMTSDLWQTCRSDMVTVERLKQCPCWIGVDLAEVRDVAALVALFEVAPKRYALLTRLYLPKAAIDKSPIAQMSGWVRDGWIVETDGDQADYQRIENDLVAWCQLFPHVKEIDFDRALAAQMQQSLKRRFEGAMGRDAVERLVITVPQTVETMNPAMQSIERLVLSKEIEHDGNEAFAWMVGNIVVERNYKDEIYPRKAGGKDSANKIDGPVALFTCHSRAMQGITPLPEYQVLFFGVRSVHA